MLLCQVPQRNVARETIGILALWPVFKLLRSYVCKDLQDLGAHWFCLAVEHATDPFCGLTAKGHLPAPCTDGGGDALDQNTFSVDHKDFGDKLLPGLCCATHVTSKHVSVPSVAKS